MRALLREGRETLDVTLRLGDNGGNFKLGDRGGSKKSAGGELGKGDACSGRDGEEGEEGVGLSGKDSSARLVCSPVVVRSSRDW